MHCGILWDGSLKLHFEMFKDKAPSLMEVSLTSEFLNSTMSVLVSYQRLIACQNMHFIILDNYKDSHLDNH